MNLGSQKKAFCYVLERLIHIRAHLTNLHEPVNLPCRVYMHLCGLHCTSERRLFRACASFYLYSSISNSTVHDYSFKGISTSTMQLNALLICYLNVFILSIWNLATASNVTMTPNWICVLPFPATWIWKKDLYPGNSKKLTTVTTAAND